MNNLNTTAKNHLNFQNSMYRNSRNHENTISRIQPFPQQQLGNPEHHQHLNNLGYPTVKKAPWSPTPRRHGFPQHSRYRFVPDAEFPQQSVLLQGIFFPIRQPGNVLLNTQLMAPPLHRLQYQGLAPTTLHNKAPAGYRRPYQLAPNQFGPQKIPRPVPLEHRRVLENHQPVSRYVN